ncbi:MAG: glycosyltransferase family 4 protein [Patescibacteria group bacterium]|jgi:glycosyltransferase involved in cell wall biosynthesis|nr:glycosyltransferase family 4 protein [Patescibacteria group bacterium]
MKIALIGHKGIPAKSGGVDRHVETLAYHLSLKNETVFSYNRKGYFKGSDNKEMNGVNIINISYINTKNLAAITHSFLSVIHAMKSSVDVIHFHGIGPSLLTWMPKIFTPKIKVVSTLHSFDYGNDKWGRFAKFMLRLGEKTMCKYADEVIVLTKLMADYLKDKYGRETNIIPNGAFIKDIKGFGSLEQFNIKPQKYIVSISRLIRLKGIQYLIKSFKDLKDSSLIDSDLKLVIVGDGEYQKELIKMADNREDIVFTGNQSDNTLAELYANAKLFVQSSEMEGLSLSLLEAMAYGLPILASKIPANIEAASDTAIYFQSKSINDLKNKLQEVLNDYNKTLELGSLAKERANKVFNWDKIIDDTLYLYKKNSK